MNKTENMVLKNNKPEIRINPGVFSSKGRTRSALMPKVTRPNTSPTMRDGFKGGRFEMLDYRCEIGDIKF